MARLVTVAELKRVLEKFPNGMVLRIEAADTFTPMLNRTEGHKELENSLFDLYFDTKEPDK